MSNWFEKLFGDSDKPPPLPRKALQPAQRPPPPVPFVRASPPPVPASNWQLGQNVLDDFIVERILGEGGMGKVYLLRSRSTGARFAVKRAKGLKETDLRNFAAELQTWIDLPEHPNLVACRFFRNVGHEVLIFADYIEGGTLHDWIASRKLYEGKTNDVLAQMLDIAIQSAWGLHCVHELGLVHQDVKPANILMRVGREAALKGVRPMVADYGLARARAAGGEKVTSDPMRSILISTAGGTPAYWSPEQSKGLPVTRKTDIWSWGVSMLEMFIGEIIWSSGVAASAVLEHCEEIVSDHDFIPPMPPGMVDVLRSCFQPQESSRIESLSEVVERLKSIYHSSTGFEYSIALASASQIVIPNGESVQRLDAGGTAWDDPRKWLVKALSAAGRDPSEADVLLARRGATRRGELVSDLIGYAEAKNIYETLVRENEKDVEIDLALLCSDKARIHEAAGDYPGGIQEKNQAIAIMERLVNQEGRHGLAGDLAYAYNNKAGALRDIGDNCGAAALYDQALAIFERLVYQEGRRELADDIATCYSNKAAILSELGDERGAAALHGNAIAIFEWLVNQEGRLDLSDCLANCYSNKSCSLNNLGDMHGAVLLCDQAIAIRERLVNQESRLELADDLACTYNNKAFAMSALGDGRGAVALYDNVIAIRERMVYQEGRHELSNALANAYNNKAVTLNELGDNLGAVVCYDHAIAIRERLVNQEGRRELANGLANVYTNKAAALSDLGCKRAAAALCDQAIDIYERLVNEEGRRELASDLASIYNRKAVALGELGDESGAAAFYDQAIDIYEHLVNQQGRSELAGSLANAYKNRALKFR